MSFPQTRHDTTAITPGVWMVHVPLAGSPLGTVLVYLLEHRDGLILIDTGYGDDAGRRAIERALTGIGAGWPDLTGVVLTHNHPDHVGMAAALRAAGAWVAIHERDAPSGTGFVERIEHELDLAGFPIEQRGVTFTRTSQLAHAVDTLQADRLLSHGDVIEQGGLTLHVHGTPGHSSGHVALLPDGGHVIFTGDLLMPRGEVQLDIVTHPADDPVRELRDSLMRVRALDREVALPGHGGPLWEPGTRIAESLGELDARSRRVAQASEACPGATAWEVSAGVDWGRPWPELRPLRRRFVVMQTLAHLRALVARGERRYEPSPPERFWPV